jgi:hypothetical protein
MAEHYTRASAERYHDMSTCQGHCILFESWSALYLFPSHTFTTIPSAVCHSNESVSGLSISFFAASTHFEGRGCLLGKLVASLLSIILLIFGDAVLQQLILGKERPIIRLPLRAIIAPTLKLILQVLRVYAGNQEQIRSFSMILRWARAKDLTILRGLKTKKVRLDSGVQRKQAAQATQRTTVALESLRNDKKYIFMKIRFPGAVYSPSL